MKHEGRRPHFGGKAPQCPKFDMQRGERRPHFGMKREGRRPHFGGKAPFGPKFGPQAPQCEKH